MLACCSVTLIRVDVCGLRGVSRRKVRSDVTRARRAWMRKRRFRRQNALTFCQLQQTRMHHYPWRVGRTSSHQRLLDMKDMASGTELSEQGLTSFIGERCPHPQIHFFRVGAAPVSFDGALEVHTGNVLSRTDTEQSGPRATVALRPFPAMSVTEARFWC